MTRVVALASSVLLFVGISVYCWADAYKWTDESGQIHYTQSPPPNGEATRIITPSGASTTNQSAGNETNETNGTNSKVTEKTAEVQQQNEEMRKQLAAQQERMKLNCDAAQHNLKILRAVGTNPYKDSDGKIVHMTAEDQKTKVAAAQKQVDSFCSEAKPAGKPNAN